ncbi:MAG TPA: metal ABC transporter permease [Solirubrobacterales bacterium]|nr:metal ABC transporter permease [Solirubrobacterales bacterium]
MLDPLGLPFMQRAAIEVVMLAPLAGILGAQIVLRRLAFFTHGVGAAAFPGLVIAAPAGIPPALAAAATGAGFAALLQRLTRSGAVARDAATGLLLVAALAIGVVLASDVFETGAGVEQLLFGSLLAIGDSELVVAAAVLALVAVVAARYRRAWIAAGFDDAGDGAHGLGARLEVADLALLAAVAVATIATIDAVGALLVTAVLVVPAATARLFATSVAELELGAALLALAEGLSGLLIAYRLDAPPGAVVAVLGGAVFALALLWRRIGERRVVPAPGGVPR